MKHKEQQQHRICFRDYARQSLEAFKSCLTKALDTFEVFNDFTIYDRFCILLNVINKCYAKTCFVKSKNLSTRKQESPWLTNGLMACTGENH